MYTRQFDEFVLWTDLTMLPYMWEQVRMLGVLVELLKAVQEIFDVECLRTNACSDDHVVFRYSVVVWGAKLNGFRCPDGQSELTDPSLFIEGSGVFIDPN